MNTSTTGMNIHMDRLAVDFPRLEVLTLTNNTVCITHPHSHFRSFRYVRRGDERQIAGYGDATGSGDSQNVQLQLPLVAGSGPTN